MAHFLAHKLLSEAFPARGRPGRILGVGEPRAQRWNRTDALSHAVSLEKNMSAKCARETPHTSLEGPSWRARCPRPARGQEGEWSSHDPPCPSQRTHATPRKKVHARAPRQRPSQAAAPAPSFGPSLTRHESTSLWPLYTSLARRFRSGHGGKARRAGNAPEAGRNARLSARRAENHLGRPLPRFKPCPLLQPAPQPASRTPSLAARGGVLTQPS